MGGAKFSPTKLTSHSDKAGAAQQGGAKFSVQKLTLHRPEAGAAQHESDRILV